MEIIKIKKIRFSISLAPWHKWNGPVQLVAIPFSRASLNTYISLNKKIWTSEKAQEIKTLVSETDDLSSILGTHRVDS